MKSFLSILILSLIVGCSKNQQETVTSMQASFGNRNELVLVIDDSLWVGNLGDSIRAHFAQPIFEDVSSEPIFDLIQLDPNIFTQRAKKARNIVLFSVQTQHEFLLQKSVYATPQNFFFLRAKTKNDLLKLFKSKADSITSVFKAAELNEEMHKVVRTSTKDLSELKDFFGCTLKVPNAYHLQVKSEFPFLWYQKDLPSGNVNLILYEFPITEIENQKAPLEDHLLQARNYMGKKFLKTAKDSAYLTTNTFQNPKITTETILQMPAYKITGNWETVNDYLKGPFVCYAIKDEYYQRYLFIEGFVNNPLKNNRDQILEIEAIIKTINFNEN
ncbi:DUF4837 family protein [Myroides sp. JBRI-B21084]|uniref:DUF4837 family protein n=1 Tax=Myroides sp. JBRI-B21084 TaxID=3119977 RepID=UPI0026E141F3|nr:DUF4837 family protein [Paenimyroides cloacae]WKW46570.1 DUF4837 family protein [Paenimyroides cloacae]